MRARYTAKELSPSKVMASVTYASKTLIAADINGATAFLANSAGASRWLSWELDNQKAQEFFTTLNSINRYAILFRIQTAKKKEQDSK